MAFSPSSLISLVLAISIGILMTNAEGLGSKLVTYEEQMWVSDNGTFGFGFTSAGRRDQFQLAIWFAQLPGDRTLVWSANRNSTVGKNAILEFDATGNLVLMDNHNIVWTSNTSNMGVERAVLLESGNLMLIDSIGRMIWQSFSHPSDTLLPSQQLTVSQQLASKTLSHSGCYTLKMQKQPTSTSLSMSYNLPMSRYSSGLHASHSYWSAPDVSNAKGNVVATLNEAGSFGILYGSSSDGVVYIYKNDGDLEGLFEHGNHSISPSVFRRLTLETNGNLRIYRWDDNVNGSRQWISEWAAVSNPCDIPGACGTGICRLDRTKTNASCTCLPEASNVSTVDKQCLGSSPLNSSCDGYQISRFKMMGIPQTNYYFSGPSVVKNYSDISQVSTCGDACLSNCECVASVYGLREEKAYCWVLRSLEFGGYEDSGSSLFIKLPSNTLVTPGGNETRTRNHFERSTSDRRRILVLPLVLCIGALIGLLSFLLYFFYHRRTPLHRDLDTSMILSGNPVCFSYRELQVRTNNFLQLLGTGGFGSVYKGSLGDGTPIAVKKLDKILPHGEREFVTEVSTIGSMHHMNLVRLCGYCSEGPHRLLVYEFMVNGSLDKWIFSSSTSGERLLDWSTRFSIALATAQGIAYFHEQCRNRIIHCDIKPENILLDENFCPKVSDFGLAKLMGREHSHVITMVRGTRGYLAPEWVSNRPITVKADVYSFGMVLLEIIGGRRNLDMSFEADEFFYPAVAYKEMVGGDPLNVADKRLRGEVDEDQLERLLEVAFWCIQDEVCVRPSMGEVVKMLDGSVPTNKPPLPQAVWEMMKDDLVHVYRAMKREINELNAFAARSFSQGTYTYSTMSPR